MGTDAANVPTLHPLLIQEIPVASTVRNHYEQIGRQTWRCNFCHHVVKGEDARLRAHLMQPNGAGRRTRRGVRACMEVVPHEVRAAMKAELEAADAKKEQKKEARVNRAIAQAGGPEEYLCQRKLQACIQPGQVQELRGDETGADELDMDWATFFYANNIPFNAANEHFFRAVEATMAFGRKFRHVPEALDYKPRLKRKRIAGPLPNEARKLKSWPPRLTLEDLWKMD